ncbi:MAG: RluA family pseudouridine synthase, partial [Desulfomonilaceae bacterium]
RSRSDRKRMSTVTGKGRAAVTSWKVKQRFGSVTLLEIHPETGRTHQIRVHLASIGLPILGDKVYGTKSRKKKHDGQIHLNLGSVINRQALHAAQLTFKHPTSFRIVEFFSPLPHDIQEAIRICGGIII